MDTSVLDSNSSDKKVTVWKNIINEVLSKMLPVGASFLTDVIFSFVPNQREDRIADFLRELSNQFDNYQKNVENLENRIKLIESDKGQLHLLELGFQFAAETDSTFLHHCYAYYIFNNLDNKTMDDIQREKILKVIAELNEYEIVHLLNFLYPSYVGNVSEFHKKFENILMPRERYLGVPDDAQEFNAFFDYYKVSLEQKGLIIGKPEVKNGTLSFDKKKYSITAFGRIVVEAIYDEDFFTRINEGDGKDE